MTERIKTFKKEISSANILSVEVGTNTPMGGDAGHGGITVFRLKDLGATAWKCVVTRGLEQTEIEQPDLVTLVFYGDTEADTFMQALEYALHIYEVQRSTKEAEQ